MSAAVFPLDRGAYVPHELHRGEQAWTETNCYVDLWIELLHAMRLEPVAVMAFTVAIDWEGDQWTFFKFPLEDLYDSFGIDTMELQIWRPLPEAILTQVERGRPVIVEVDAFHLPDTRGVSYRLEHVKTSVAVHGIDPAAQRMTYFHNAGFFEVEGEDYANLLRSGGPCGPGELAPYTELVKLDRLRRPSGDELRKLARRQLRKHFARAPGQNPIRSFEASFARDIEWLKPQPIGTFHAYSFATLRQLGANFACAAAFARWLGGEAARAAEPFQAIAESAKTVQFRLARVANAKKAYDPGPSLGSMAQAWDAGLSLLHAAAD